MTFEFHTNIFNSHSAHRLPSDRKSPCDLISDAERKAQSMMKDQYRADLNHHLNSDLIRSYVPRSN